MTDWQWLLVILAGVLVVAFTYVRRRKRPSIIVMSTSKPGNQAAPASDKGASSPGPGASA